METPITYVNKLIMEHIDNPSVVTNMIKDYYSEILQFEANFIKKIYIDALPLDLSIANKERLAEKYYLENFTKK
ncbi:hypothetical protein DBR39_18350 [Chryseobacterium sp. KBW03]|uniref:hypothetical protein n=1 Tax=Chryseobacterium sp. KBW03 TaxID=2153362 RepID=UPI000F5A729B|nr:hypothetical protein [Chryseobacterium sp. KBW03]RQO35438.1 hypothetical protein DBR39_18350 [Chryseobacterium sp. KBW03]